MIKIEMGHAFCAAALWEMKFGEVYDLWHAGTLPMIAFSHYCSRLRSFTRRYPGFAAWPVCILDLLTCSRTLDEIERMHAAGVVIGEVYDDWCQAWRLGAPRLSGIHAKWENVPLRPRVAEAFAAMGRDPRVSR